MDPVLLSSIATVASALITVSGVIFGPIVSAHFKHKDEMEAYDKKILVEHRIAAIETYLENVGRYLFHERNIDKSISQALSSVYIYAPKELWEQIDQMNTMIINIENATDDRSLRLQARKQYVELCKAFSMISYMAPNATQNGTKKRLKKPKNIIKPQKTNEAK